VTVHREPYLASTMVGMASTSPLRRVIYGGVATAVTAGLTLGVGPAASATGPPKPKPKPRPFVALSHARVEAGAVGVKHVRPVVLWRKQTLAVRWVATGAEQKFCVLLTGTPNVSGFGSWTVMPQPPDLSVTPGVRLPEIPNVYLARHKYPLSVCADGTQRRGPHYFRITFGIIPQ